MIKISEEYDERSMTTTLRVLLNGDVVHQMYILPDREKNGPTFSTSKEYPSWDDETSTVFDLRSIRLICDWGWQSVSDKDLIWKKGKDNPDKFESDVNTLLSLLPREDDEAMAYKYNALKDKAFDKLVFKMMSK